MQEILFPMTAEILTVGHIKCLEKLRNLGFVNVGLLSEKALEGYKDCAVPYKDREYVLETVAIALGNIDIHRQDSLDPFDIARKLKCDAIASGDGFEPVEKRAAKRLKMKMIDVRLTGEKEKSYSSSSIKKALNERKSTQKRRLHTLRGNVGVLS